MLSVHTIKKKERGKWIGKMKKERKRIATTYILTVDFSSKERD